MSGSKKRSNLGAFFNIEQVFRIWTFQGIIWTTRIKKKKKQTEKTLKLFYNRFFSKHLHETKMFLFRFTDEKYSWWSKKNL